MFVKAGNASVDSASKEDTGVNNSGIFTPKATKAIEHREGNWSRRRLLLDVGATDAYDKATRHRSGGLVWTFPLRGLLQRLRPSPLP